MYHTVPGGIPGRVAKVEMRLVVGVDFCVGNEILFVVRANGNRNQSVS